MVRFYQRKTVRGHTYCTETLLKACSDVRSGIRRICDSSRAYGIPRSTIRDHIICRRNLSNGGGGRSRTFTDIEEAELAAIIRVMARLGIGLNKREIQQIVQSYLQLGNQITPFRDSIPGNDWLISFYRRHKLKARQPEAKEKQRFGQETDPFVILGFYDTLQTLISDLGLTNKPSQVFNTDETGIEHEKADYVICPVGEMVSRRVTNAKEMTIVLVTVGADGRKLSPLILFKGKNTWTVWLSQRPDHKEKARYSASPNGWMTTDVFENWFERAFIPECGLDRPVILIYDGHASHISVKTVINALKNDIHLVLLPPKTTHILQALDKTVFRSLKSVYGTLSHEWRHANLGRPMIPCRQISH